MTEIERIKDEGWLSESFWKAETICDYHVSEEMKKIWAILLDLYKEFSRVCEKHNLQYWTDGGTMLGAVRHKGFIPWDDDIDVIMPRKDYNRLISLAKEFEEPYVLISNSTFPEYGFSYNKLGNTNTSIVENSFKYCNFPHCISIDIFPLDKTEKDDFITKKNNINELIMANSARMRKTKPILSETDKEKISKYYKEDLSLDDACKRIKEIASQDEEKETKFVSDIVVTTYSHEKTLWEKSIYDSTVKMPFECFEVNVPGGYDLYLKTLYGNYMEFPPKEKRGIWHDTQFFPEIPYKEYYKQQKIDLLRTINNTGGGV